MINFRFDWAPVPSDAGKGGFRSVEGAGDNTGAASGSGSGTDTGAIATSSAVANVDSVASAALGCSAAAPIFCPHAVQNLALLDSAWQDAQGWYAVKFSPQ